MNRSAKLLNNIRNDRRIEIHSGPDRLGRYCYTLYWLSNYHPGDPKGENRIAERGQIFFADGNFIAKHKVSNKNVFYLRHKNKEN